MPVRTCVAILTVVTMIVSAECGGQESSFASTDTSMVNDWLRKGRNLHYRFPDSAIYYYQLIQDHLARSQGSTDQNLSGAGKAYLETVIRSLNYTGNIYYYNDEYSRSEYYYRQSLDIATKSGLEDFRGQALFDLGYIRYVNNRYSEAEKLFEESLLIYRRTENIHGMYDALQACGLTSRRLGDYIMADSCYRQALELAISLGDSMLISDVKLHAGILLCEQGSLDEGIAMFEEALAYYEGSGNDKAISLALLNIGVVMKMVNEYDKALHYIQRSTEIEELSQQKSQLVVRYYNLADLFLDMGEPASAYEYCRKIMGVANEIGSRPFKAECNFLLGKYHYISNDFKEAQRYLALASDSAAKTNNKPLITNIHLYLAKTQNKKGDYELAVSNAITAYRLAGEMHMLMGQKEASSVLAEAFEKSGKPAEALEWHKTFLIHSDSINYFNQRKEIQSIEARYNYEKKEKENELLRNRASLQEQKLRNRTIVTFSLLLGIALSIVLILLLIRRNRDSKLLYQQQQMLNLRHLQEMEQELDGKQRELTSKMLFLNQKNELIKRLISRLQDVQNSPDNSLDELGSIVNELKIDAPQSNWKEFDTQFIQVHPDFYKRLYEKHPQLTSYEQRMCAFLRMNLNSKEISAITGRSLKSIEVTRSRIRQKLSLSRNDNLSSFLASV